MSNDPMTLIEKLRNPAWQSGGGPFVDAVLQVGQTRNTMQEAADRIATLHSALAKIERIGWREGKGEKCKLLLIECRSIAREALGAGLESH